MTTSVNICHGEGLGEDMSKSLHQSLSHLERFMFILPRDNVAEHVLIPSFSAAQEVKIQAGYFSSNSFSEVAEGMEEFLSKNEAPLKLIISPMLTSNDYEVITSDEYEREKFFSNIFHTMRMFPQSPS